MPERRRHIGLLVSSLAAVNATWAVVFWEFEPERVSIESLLDHPVKWAQGDEFMVDGWLVHGSIVELGSPCRLHFRIRSSPDSGRELNVHYARCLVPDTFPWPPHKEPAPNCSRDVGIRLSGRLYWEQDSPHATAGEMYVRRQCKYEMKQRAKPRPG